MSPPRFSHTTARGVPRRSHAAWHVLVLAKAPVPGHVKTRLCPPLSPREAADLAAAALTDTLEAVAACGAGRRIVALDGAPGDWLPTGFEVIRQRGNDLGARLASAWSDAGGPGLQIGMDTPQVTAALLDACLAVTDRDARATASLGMASDGGWWAIGMRAGWQHDPFAGVRMSTPHTGQAQWNRLRAIGHQVAELPVLRDVDRMADAIAVAEDIPESRFASVLAATAGPGHSR